MRSGQNQQAKSCGHNLRKPKSPIILCVSVYTGIITKMENKNARTYKIIQWKNIPILFLVLLLSKLLVSVFYQKVYTK